MASAIETLTVKLSKEDMEALDRIVELTGVGNTRGGRSSACRMLLRPFLESIKLASSDASKTQVIGTLWKEMYDISKLIDASGKLKKQDGEQMVLGEIEVASA